MSTFLITPSVALAAIKRGLERGDERSREVAIALLDELIVQMREWEQRDGRAP